jgi:hypothetical protein
MTASGIGQVSQLRRRLNMIMTGQKCRSLTWTGCASLLAIGLLLLPLVPVGAQQPEKKKENKVIVVGGNGGFQIVLDAQETPEQKALKLLKQAMKILAEKKQARPIGTAKRPDPEKLREAHRLLDVLATQVAKQRRELQLAEAQLRQFRARLSQVEGKPACRINLPFQMQFKVRPFQDAQKPKAIDKKGKGIVIPNQLLLRIQDGKIIGVEGEKEKPDQFQDLKLQLKQLRGEVEALRREVERTIRPSK